MTIVLDDLLPNLLYVVLIIFVIVLIALAIKLIKTLKKFDSVLVDVNKKMRKCDGVFDLIDSTADFANSISDKIINGISNLIGFVFKKRGKKDE